MRMLLLAAGAAALLAIDADAQDRGRGRRDSGGDRTWKFLSKKYDKNKNGKITFKEYKRDKEKFESLDRDRDGVLTKADFEGGGRRGGGRRGRGDRRGNMRGGEVATLGKKAPDFELPTIKNPKKTIKLSSFADKKPVALIFGSYT